MPIHITQETIDWVAYDKLSETLIEDEPYYIGIGSYRMGRNSHPSACGVEAYFSTRESCKEDTLTAVNGPYYPKEAQKQIMAGYKLVTCEKCIEILKKHGL